MLVRSSGRWARVISPTRIAFLEEKAGTPPKPAALAAKKPAEGLVNSFAVGCDPEFVVIGASGPVNLAEMGFEHEGPFGYDHGGDVGELRPRQSTSVERVTEKIKEILTQHVPRLRAISGLKLRAGGYFSYPTRRREFISLGGHVHLDVSPYAKAPLSPDEDIYTANYRKVKNQTLFDALDHVTLRLEALDILPRKECTDRRERSNYGHLGDFRAKEKVGYSMNTANYRMEYRAMASWLYDPRAAHICMTAAKLAAVDPKHALETLGKTHSFEKLTSWLESFKGKDRDADKILETMLDKGVKGLQADPEADVLKAWGVE